MTDIDSLISAEIPDEEKEPELYKLVVKHMLHGPCRSCLINSKCSKKFPKPFVNET